LRPPTFRTEPAVVIVARVFVDTNVLFPFSVMDLMLTLTEDSVHEVLWTEALLAEWERVIVREQRRSAASAAAITAAIREYFADSEVPESMYGKLVAQMPGGDPDDRVHMAAAVAGGAETIVTWNQADFPAGPLAGHGIRVCAPDQYLCDLLDAWPDEVLGTVVRLAGEKRRPPMTPTELASLLAKAGVPAFAERLQTRWADQGGEGQP
jgi:predicted nucleic acid-binding protein